MIALHLKGAYRGSVGLAGQTLYTILVALYEHCVCVLQVECVLG